MILIKKFETVCMMLTKRPKTVGITLPEKLETVNDRDMRQG